MKINTKIRNSIQVYHLTFIEILSDIIFKSYFKYIYFLYQKDKIKSQCLNFFK